MPFDILVAQASANRIKELEDELFAEIQTAADAMTKSAKHFTYRELLLVYSNRVANYFTNAAIAEVQQQVLDEAVQNARDQNSLNPSASGSGHNGEDTERV